jgi:shikimate dehydrogenase
VEGEMVEKLFAVLGDPIKHSMSPFMHNELFSLYDLDAHYHPLLVRSDDLGVAVNGLRAIGAAGFNVTVPHKSAIIPFLDRVDHLALEIGAVNTVVNDNGKLVGYNTDGIGFVKGLEQELNSITDRSVLIIGAGGAARAIYFTLAHKGIKKIDICNRTLKRAEDLIKDCPFSVNSKPITLEETADKLPDYDLIINTTLIGMFPHMDEQPLSLLTVNKQAFVCDIIYNPLETKFLLEAKRQSLMTQNGIDMFVFQGALAFEKWTGIFPDIERMKKIVMKHLGGTKC